MLLPNKSLFCICQSLQNALTWVLHAVFLCGIFSLSFCCLCSTKMMSERAHRQAAKNRCRVFFVCEHLCACMSGSKQAWVLAHLGLWRYSLMHCRPCFFCRVLPHSEQVAQLEKAPVTNRCPLLLRTFSFSFTSLSLSFALCCSLSRFLPCRGNTQETPFRCKCVPLLHTPCGCCCC